VKLVTPAHSREDNEWATYLKFWISINKVMEDNGLPIFYQLEGFLPMDEILTEFKKIVNK
jgi:hypothetical protein